MRQYPFAKKSQTRTVIKEKLRKALLNDKGSCKRLMKLTPGNFSCDESLSSSWTLVVEEDPVAGEHAISLAIVDHDPVGVQLGNAVRRSEIQT